jgi:hypothetical protein
VLGRFARIWISGEGPITDRYTIDNIFVALTSYFNLSVCVPGAWYAGEGKAASGRKSVMPIHNNVC